MRDLIKRILREENTKSSSGERLEKLVGDYITTTYPTAKKIRVAVDGGNIELTTLTLPDPEDERDNLIFKMSAYGMPDYKINREFLNSVQSMFSGDKKIKKIILKWFDGKEVDEDLLSGTVKQQQNESKVSNTIKRRANQQTLEKYITKGEINYPTLCDDFEDEYEYADAVIDYAIVKFLGEFDEDIEEEDYYSDVMDYLRNVCREEFGEYLIDIYKTTCTEQELDEQEQNESELTERCWKGYTQKGMKTMFGKRYPNCVKIKKKSVNESKMLDYLKQFLTGDALEKFKEEKGRKEFQKLVDIAYKLTSRDHPIEGMVGVLVGNIKKEMWGQTYTDPKNVGSRWDFHVVLRPLFTEYNPNEELFYEEKVLEFEKEFSKNVRGMGLEVTSPVQHEKVKNYKVTYEWAPRLDVKKI